MNINNYIIDKLIVNWKQLNLGDTVAITQEGWNELKSRQFWTNTAIGGVVCAVALPLAIPAGTVSVLVPGAEIGFGLYEAGQVAVGAAAGMGAGGLATKIAQDFASGGIPATDILQTKGVVGKVKRIHKKNFSDSKHVEVAFYIPNGKGGYTVQKEWIDAHHLMRLITKDSYQKRLAEEAKIADQRAREHEEQLDLAREATAKVYELKLSDLREQFERSFNKANREALVRQEQACVRAREDERLAVEATYKRKADKVIADAESKAKFELKLQLAAAAFNARQDQKAELSQELAELRQLKADVSEVLALKNENQKLRSQRKFHWGAHLLLPLLILL